MNAEGSMPNAEAMCASLSPAGAMASARAGEPSPRTVLHFIPTIGGGGAENFLRSLVRAMEGSRWRTVVVAVSVGPHGAFAEELRALGATVHDLGCTALLKPSVWLGLRRLIVLEKPDVVQTWMHHADFIGGVAAWSAGVRRVVWGVRATAVHRNAEDSDFKAALFAKALGWAAKILPRTIIANSTAAIAVHGAMGYPARKMRWIPNGVNAQRFTPDAAMGAATRAELGLAAAVPVIGFVGRFHPVKDLVLFFKAAARLQARREDVHFVLCGGLVDELYPEARAAFETLPRREQVRFVAFGASTQRYYPVFTIFTLCSASEAFPNVVLEALASAVPCVTTDAGDCKPMLEGLSEVVPIHDDVALALAWEKMLAKPAHELAALGEQGRERAVNDYSMERAAARFEEVYSDVARR